MWFGSWADLWRTSVVAVLGYIALVFMLRISGKRTLSKMNAFDLVITVALGSTFATLILSQNVPLAEGVLALGLLIGLQFVVTWLSVRSQAVRHLVKAEPSLLFYQGNMLPDAMRLERVVGAEILAAMREQGASDPQKVAAVVLETDGTLTVVRHLDQLESSTLKDVRCREEPGVP